MKETHITIYIHDLEISDKSKFPRPCGLNEARRFAELQYDRTICNAQYQ